MDVTRILEADHRTVEQLFTKISRAEGPDRGPLIDELATSLRGHMELEERVVYPAMEPVVGEEPVTEGENEHDLGRKLLDELLQLAPDGPGFGGALDALQAAIEHHVEEEEGEVFPTLRRDGSDTLAEMATPFMKERLDLGLPMEAEALAASSTKDELLAEAKAANVEGAASMTKEELAGALADQMS
jgi:iron-sulfur cluster repair protein YtfE (RIC family)